MLRFFSRHMGGILVRVTRPICSKSDGMRPLSHRIGNFVFGYGLINAFID